MTQVKPTSTKQPAEFWFAAKFFGKDKDTAMALRLLFQKIKLHGNAKPFLRELDSSWEVISSELDTIDYEELDKEIDMTEFQLSMGYKAYANYKKIRTIVPSKVIPTYNNLQEEKIRVVTKDGGTIPIDAQDKPISYKVMESKIIDFGIIKSETVVCHTATLAVLVSEITKLPLEKVDVSNIANLAVEEKVSANAVVDTLSKFNTFIAQSEYIRVLKDSLRGNQTTIPIPYTSDKQVKYAQLNLPKLTTHFMNKGHWVNPQDISTAMAKRYNLTIVNKSSEQLKSEFFQTLNMDKPPDTILFNTTWLGEKDFNFNVVANYCPIYTGLESCAWILKRIDSYPGLGLIDTFKTLLAFIGKIAKFYAFWCRSRVKPIAIIEYLKKAVGLSVKAVWGFAAFANVEEWMTSVTIDTFRETPVYKVTGEKDMYDTNLVELDMDFELVDDDLNYDLVSNTNVIVDRDKTKFKNNSTFGYMEMNNNNKRMESMILATKREIVQMLGSTGDTLGGTVDGKKSSGFGLNKNGNANVTENKPYAFDENDLVPDEESGQNAGDSSKTNVMSKSNVPDGGSMF